MRIKTTDAKFGDIIGIPHGLSGFERCFPGGSAVLVHPDGYKHFNGWPHARHTVIAVSADWHGRISGKAADQLFKFAPSWALAFGASQIGMSFPGSFASVFVCLPTAGSWAVAEVEHLGTSEWRSGKQIFVRHGETTDEIHRLEPGAIFRAPSTFDKARNSPTPYGPLPCVEMKGGDADDATRPGALYLVEHVEERVLEDSTYISSVETSIYAKRLKLGERDWPQYDQGGESILIIRHSDDPELQVQVVGRAEWEQVCEKIALFSP